MKQILLGIMLLGSWLPAQAIDLYGELGAGYLFNQVNTTDFNSAISELRFGAYLQPMVGIEVHTATGVTDAEEIDIKSSLNYQAGLALRLESPEADGGKVFFVLGYAVTDFDVERSGSDKPGTLDFDGFSYGLGAEFRLGHESPFYLNLKGVRYYAEDSVTIDVAGLGLRYQY